MSPSGSPLFIRLSHGRLFRPPIEYNAGGRECSQAVSCGCPLCIAFSGAAARDSIMGQSAVSLTHITSQLRHKTLQDYNSVETAACCEANRFRASPAVSSPSLPASRSGATVRLRLHLLVYTQPIVPSTVLSPTSYSAVDAVTRTPLKDSLASILLKHPFLAYLLCPLFSPS